MQFNIIIFLVFSIKIFQSCVNNKNNMSLNNLFKDTISVSEKFKKFKKLTLNKK